VRYELSNNGQLPETGNRSSSEEKIIGVNGKHYGPKHHAPRRLDESELALSNADTLGRSPLSNGEAKSSPLESLDGNCDHPESQPGLLENGETIEISPSDLITLLEGAGGTPGNGDEASHNSHVTSDDAKNNVKTSQTELTAPHLDDPEVAATELKSATRKLLEYQMTVSAIFQSCHKHHAIETQKSLGMGWHDSGEVFPQSKSIYSLSSLRKYDSDSLDELFRFIAGVIQRLEGRGPRIASDATPWEQNKAEIIA